ncbi:uncharacterized protein LOC129309213 isoform X2 [Prosopis cineraria]|nr:uncharacterized protein LOC129309213 isoform X2 [Prosopis cineraria]XP_054806644.1 uncharacterized protein LOC129309213 isoform X2 [Prosopis cineraria]XP_054806653.1 uncharacterized protein LOC129309213 isoform X2 [Prosopis cineraria]XP_054806663.1 uncharacterized protein LOC129309213 isoform X2 [Prosopis cineraria]XP_054806673.1 uncharacterized protein LOC129309213 isoform X2 [Prosopis cineraria]XP_054806680.1 uncharacterized protein LOC129309213 isoform X2 [Prosopis cineraria]XP_05480669
MASSSLKAVFCYIHTRGRFVKDSEGKMQYEGGTAYAKLIREGMNYQNLSTMVSSLLGTQSDVKLKFTVKFDRNIYIDLVNDEGVEQLINFNDDQANVYAVEGDEIIKTSAASPSSDEELQASSYEGDDGVIWLLPKLEGDRPGPVIERRDHITINGNKSDEDFIQWYVFFSSPSESFEFFQANKQLTKNVFSLPTKPSTVQVFQQCPKDSDNRDKEKETGFKQKDEQKVEVLEESYSNNGVITHPKVSILNTKNEQPIRGSALTADMELQIIPPLSGSEHESYWKQKLVVHGACKDWNFQKGAKNVNVSGQTRDTILDDAIFKQCTSLGNTALHVAVSNGNHDMIEKVAQNAPHLFTVVNNNNDTALHVAARTGHGSTIKFLLNNFLLFVRGAINGHDHQSSLEMILMVSLALFRNKQGNTFLHEAFMFGSDNGSFDAFDTYSGSEFEARFKRIVNHLIPFAINVEGKSLLYLTIEFNCKDVLDKLMNFCVEGELKPQGKSPFLPILINNLDMLQTIFEKKHDWVHLKNEKGWLPLHCAAMLGYLKGVSFLAKKCPPCIMERDNNGFLPIHWACFNGHVKVVQELLQKWHWDPIEVLDDNGQNLLHHACQGGSYEVVRYFLKHPKFKIMIYQKDNNGDTPLHLATKMSRPKIVHALTWDNRVDLSLLNHNSLTALDIAEQKQGNNNLSLSQRLTWKCIEIC